MRKLNGLVKAFSLSVVISLSILGSLPSAFAADGMKVTHAWARPTMGAGKTSGAYFVLRNDTGQDDRIISASGTVASTIEVHEHIQDNGVMRMREVKGGIPIKSGETVMFAPGGYHIMMIGMNRKLAKGDEVMLMLKFESGKMAHVKASIQMSPPKGAGMDHNTMDHSKHKMPTN